MTANTHVPRSVVRWISYDRQPYPSPTSVLWQRNLLHCMVNLYSVLFYSSLAYARKLLDSKKAGNCIKAERVRTLPFEIRIQQNPTPTQDWWVPIIGEDHRIHCSCGAAYGWGASGRDSETCPDKQQQILLLSKENDRRLTRTDQPGKVKSMKRSALRHIHIYSKLSCVQMHIYIYIYVSVCMYT